MGLLAGRHAIVTGAARGIGRAIAELFREEGARVTLVDILEDEGERAARQLAGSDGGAFFVRADVAEEEDVRRAVARAKERFGVPQILVNNAGVFAPAEAISAPTAAWQRAQQVMFLGSLSFCREVARALREAGRGGSIVQVSSINAYRGAERSGPYNAAKGALDQLTRCLAVEWAPYGIRVNSVNPGFVRTAMSVVDGVNELETPFFQEVYVRARRIPLARPAEPREIAQAVLFLASDLASYVTGHTLAVDGGLSVTY